MTDKNSLRKRAKQTLAFAAALLIVLAVSTYALSKASVSVNDHSVATGTIAIDINNGKPVITEDEFLFEPGMRVIKDFTVTNEGTADAWYKVYFDEVEGELSKVLLISVYDQDQTYYSGSVLDFASVEDVDYFGSIEPGETKTLTLKIEYPKTAGNETKNQTMSFVLNAIAVQVKNNPDKQFS
jgi:hypothetical protein